MTGGNSVGGGGWLGGDICGGGCAGAGAAGAEPPPPPRPPAGVVAPLDETVPGADVPVGPSVDPADGAVQLIGAVVVDGQLSLDSASAT